MKIKSNLKRTLSILLAVMLLAATAIPMSLFSVSAASEEEIAEAVEAVKTAWGKVKGERIQLDFHNYVDINKGEHVVSGTDTIVTKYDSVPSDLPATITKTEFGNEYYKLATESGSSPNPYTTAFRFSYPSAITENNLTIGDVASIDFCYKIENNTNTWGGFFDIGFNTHDIWFWDASRKTGWMPFTTSWKHVSLALDSNTDWDTAAPWKNKNGEIDLASVTNNTLASDKYFFVSLSQNFISTYVKYFYLGGVFLTLKGPELDENLTAAGILQAYYAADWTGCTNTEPLAAAITNLCAAMGDDAVDIVKGAVATAWNNVEGERIKLDFASYYDSNRAQHTANDGVLNISASAPTDSVEADLADGYYTASIPTVGTVNHGDHTAFSFVATDRTIDASKIDTLSFWAKKTTEETAYPALWVAVNSASYKSDASVNTWDKLESGGYVGGSSNVVNSTWTHFTIGAALFGKVTEGTNLTNIVLSCMNTSKAALDLSVGGVYITLKAPSLTEGADEANILQTYYASDWTGCINTEALDAAITNLCAAIGETKVQEQQAIVAVKKAYNADSAFTADNSVWELKTALKNADKLVQTDSGNQALFDGVRPFYKDTIVTNDCTFDDKLDICDLVTAWAYTNSEEKVDIFTYALKDATGVIPDGVCDNIRTDLLN